MGINLVIACHEHKVYGYSMRGEEAWDVQWWFRNHAGCFERRKISIYRDSDNYPGMGGSVDGFTAAWEYEDRPYPPSHRPGGV